MLSKIVEDVFSDLRLAGHVADWLEDYCMDRPEAETYVRKFRRANKINVNDAIDVVAKFGNPIERKQVQRFRRLLKRCRYKHGYVPRQAMPLVKAMDFKSRVKFNMILKTVRNGVRTGVDSLHSHKFRLKTKLADVGTRSMITSSLVLNLSDMLGAKTLVPTVQV
jgi:hypothetical protein